MAVTRRAAVMLAADKAPSVPANPAAEAKAEPEMKRYTEKVHGTDAKFDMLPIPGGEYLIGSPDKEPGHKPDESPQRKVKIAPFWMGKCEVTWDEYDIWNHNLDIKKRQVLKLVPTVQDLASDVVTRPTKPYTDMTFGMGHDGYPAICMTQLAAKTYCQWLSAKTGHYYRLPTEAEWEYAGRGGLEGKQFPWGNEQPTSKVAHFGQYHGTGPVGRYPPNGYGLHDVAGSVWEWTNDWYDANYYSSYSHAPLAPAGPCPSPRARPSLRRCPACPW